MHAVHRGHLIIGLGFSGLRAQSRRVPANSDAMIGLLSGDVANEGQHVRIYRQVPARRRTADDMPGCAAPLHSSRTSAVRVAASAIMVAPIIAGRLQSTAVVVSACHSAGKSAARERTPRFPRK
jgi:hypothetical protein